jgi:hypothetical protein
MKFVLKAWHLEPLKRGFIYEIKAPTTPAMRQRGTVPVVDPICDAVTSSSTCAPDCVFKADAALAESGMPAT